MTDNSEYDALGELFRQRLENHQMPVDDGVWEDIERSLAKRKNKNMTLWWYGIATAAAAAAVAALLIVARPVITDELPAMTVSQQTNTEEHVVTSNNETIPNIVEQETVNVAVTKPAVREKPLIKINSDDVEYIIITEPDETEYYVNQQFNDSVSQSPLYSVTQLPNDSVSSILDISLVADIPDEDANDTKKTDKWLMAAVIGMGNSKGINNDNSSAPLMNEQLSKNGNMYAVTMSENIQSLSELSKDEFTNVKYSSPFSVGVTARKMLWEKGGVESGLVYTFLASSFEWSKWSRQNLHYVGIPVNLIVYFGENKSNWRLYFSGGFTVDKCLRAVYTQEGKMWNGIRTTTVKSHIDGLQWSVNSALGVNYRLAKGFGIYLEPRIGYWFKNEQPISIRTENPVSFTINLGLNYEL
jgi:hypothetical protein